MRWLSRDRDIDMLTRLIGLAAAAVLIATPVAATALTVTNQDKREHTLFILEEDDDWSATIQPGKTLRNLCTSPCSIAIGAKEELDLEGNEVVTIEDGRLIVIR
jgi:hypothetical protein